MPGCPSPDQLRRLLADALDGPDATTVEAHVNACDSCQAVLERLMADAATREGPEPGSPTESVHEKEAREEFLRRLEAEPPAAITTETKPQNLAKIAPGLVAVPRTTGEVQSLLRKRLLFIAIVMAATFAAYAMFIGVFSPTVFTLVTYPLVLAGIGTLAVILWRGRLLSTPELRWIEVLLFGGLALFFTWVQWLCFASGWLAASVDRDFSTVMLSARALSLNWVLLMVGYGLLIPNTWRRCAVAVGVMAVWPVLLNACLAPWDLPTGQRVIFLLETALNMGLGAASALYGSHRIETLRHKASEARKVGPYQLKRRLGAGGMGEVYLAEHALLRRPCAVKLIRPERAGDPHHVRRFEREVQATATLTHPNTVEIFDYGHAEDGTFYYVMEYLSGLSLAELVGRAGPLPPERVVHLLRQVCGALREAHALGLVHRDVKPGNVLVCERGGQYDVAKLLDFGLVRVCIPDGQTLTQEGTIAGTPAYMSPEQAGGRGNPDARSDIYSLGAVAYFLLTGQPPFLRATAVQTLAAHLGEAVIAPNQLRADVPGDLQVAVMRCLEKDPSRRFPDADALDVALGGCACAGRWTRESAADWWREHATPAA